MGRSRRLSSGEDSLDGGLFFGDEELEEGNMLHENRATSEDAGRGDQGGRRLSRELEGGFMDDSDEEAGNARNARSIQG